MLTIQQQLAGWLAVLIIVILSFAAGIRIRDHLRKRHQPDPLAPMDESGEPYRAERFSLRRMK